MAHYKPDSPLPQDRQARLAYLFQFMKLTNDQRHIIARYFGVIKSSHDAITDEMLSSLERAIDDISKSPEILADVLSRVHTEALVMYRAAEELFELIGGEVIHIDRN